MRMQKQTLLSAARWQIFDSLSVCWVFNQYARLTEYLETASNLETTHFKTKILGFCAVWLMILIGTKNPMYWRIKSYSLSTHCQDFPREGFGCVANHSLLWMSSYFIDNYKIDCAHSALFYRSQQFFQLKACNCSYWSNQWHSIPLIVVVDAESL